MQAARGLVLKHFGSSSDDPFVLISTSSRRNEESFTLVRRDVLVSLMLGGQQVTGLSIGRTEREGSELLLENYSLITVAQALDETFDSTVVTKPTGSLNDQLLIWSRLLHRYATPLLEGDVSQRADFKRARAKAQRLSNRERWGTATGETPRFQSRPDLTALFEDTTNTGQKNARASDPGSRTNADNFLYVNFVSTANGRESA